MIEYIPVIGLEIHAELTTHSKLFCRCPNTSNDLATPPNTAICPVCIGLPGALPVLNGQAVRSIIGLGQSLGCCIPERTKWDRKNYFYPDLPKGYQISQYDEPICQAGEMSWRDREGNKHTVALTRIHLEEDTGKLTHPAAKDYSLIDYNRSSIPLLELVTEPVIRSAKEARECAQEYQLQLRELGVAEANMEKGQMRCEANISVIPHEYENDPEKRLSGTKVEVKNLNSFRSLERAINHEIERQACILAEGGTLRQETRGWNENKGETYVMREKETSDDYRYFPEPDLGQLDVASIKTDSVVKSSERTALRDELLESGVKPEFVHIVTRDPARRAFIEQLQQEEFFSSALLPLAAQWLSQEPSVTVFTAREIIKALKSLQEGSLRPALFKEAIVSASPGDLDVVLQELTTHSRISDLKSIIATVLAAHPSEVERYKAGQTQLFGFFIGQVRKVLSGKGDPADIAEEIKRQLE